MQQKIKHIVSESTFFIFGFYFSRGLRIALAIVIPLLAGWFFKRPDIGIVASSGALVAGLGDNPGSIRVKFYTQSIAALFYFLVVFVCQLLISHEIIFGIWITLCGFFFSMFFIYGSRAVSVSTSSLLCVVYACSFEANHIITNTLGMMMGIVWYGFISLVLWRIQPYRVIEQKISENIKLLNEYTELIHEYFLLKIKNPANSQKQTEILNKLFEKQTKIHSTHEDIRENLFKLRINAKSFSAKGRKMTLIFSALIDLYEQLLSLNCQDDKLIQSLVKSGLKRDFEYHLSNMEKILYELSWSINFHKKVTVTIDTAPLDRFKEKILSIEEKEKNNEKSVIDINALKHVRFIFKSFYKQTGFIKSLINGEFRSERKQYEDLDLEKFTRQYNYSFSTFKANLNLKSNIFKHALRVSVAISVSYIICTLLKIEYFAWVYLTIILILKPFYGNTKNSSIQRLQGTLIGGVLTLGLLLVTHNIYVISIVTFICIVGAYSFIPISYRTGVAFVTIFVILLIFLEHSGSDGWTNIYHRLGGTTIAVVISFILSFSFLPTWEYKNLPVLIEKLLKYNLNYFTKITYNLLNVDKLSDTDIKLSRKDVLLGTSNLSSTFQRIVSEPKISKNYKSDIYNIQTFINLLSTRISSLRSYINENSKASDIDKQLISSIENTLNKCLLNIKGSSFDCDTECQEKEEELNVLADDQSLISYQLREINLLSQQIYSYINKLNNFQEWKDSKRDFSI